MGHFGEKVHDDEDARVAVRWGKIRNKIHGDMSPGSGGVVVRLKEPVGRVAGWFGALTRVAIVDVFVDVAAKCWPPEESEKQLGGALYAGVPGGWRVVVIPQGVGTAAGRYVDLSIAQVEAIT
jgi:hypothetical protein